MKIQIFFFALLGMILYISAELPEPISTRVKLKVSRSLPGETEEHKVRTTHGDTATLIVKRREKSGSLDRTNPTNKDDMTRLKSLASDVASSIENITNVNKSNSAEKVGEYQPTFVKLDMQTPQNSDRMMNYNSWTPLDVRGRALHTVESTTENYLNWKPLAVQKQLNSPDEAQSSHNGLIFFRNSQMRREKGLDLQPDESEERLAYIAHQPKPKTRTNIGANLSKNRGGKNVPPEVTVRSQINVKHSGKRMPMTIDSDGTPVIHGLRVPDEPIDKVQTWRNARVINNKLVTGNPSDDVSILPDNEAENYKFQKFFKDVNRRYGRNIEEDQQRNVYYEWNPNNHRNAILKADVYDTRHENYRSNIQKRMLHPEGSQTYPISQMYTPESQKIAPLALKPGARAPVLQYAHPELGVQPAKILKSEKRRPDNFPENQNSFTEQRHKKKYVLNDKSIVDAYNTKNYYPNHQFYGLKQHVDPPFWAKFSEISQQLKNQFSTGVERVSQLTKPVIDPLVEATHKISQNLGLSRNQEAQDKIGSVASGSSILIPALGLVASGAALGIGAVAVGRYLDVDMLKRSNENQDLLENQRNYYIIPDDGSNRTPKNIYYLQHPTVDVKNSNSDQFVQGFLVSAGEAGGTGPDNHPEVKPRSKRSVENIAKLERNTAHSVDQKFIRSGPDSLIDIIEIDGPISENMRNDLLVLNDGDQKFSYFDNGYKKRRSVDNVDMGDAQMEDGVEMDTLQSLEIKNSPEISSNIEWTDTLCAKKIFCDGKVASGLDSYTINEKTIESFFKRLTQFKAAQQVFNHIQEVI